MKDSTFDKILQKIDEKKEIEDSQHKNSRILVCDGMNTFLRGFHVSTTTNNDGLHIGGITSFLQSLGYAIKKFEPTRCIVVFDGKGGSQRRRKIYEDYKKGRKSGSSSNRFYDFQGSEDQIKKDKSREATRIARYMKALPVTFVMIDSIEADDVIAYIKTGVYNTDDNEIIIMSTDKDFLQLVDRRTTVWSPSKKNTYTPTDVYDEYGVPPHQFMLYRTIEGDTSDNIPGVPYVGEKRIKDKFSELIKKKDRVNIDEIVEYAKDRTEESTTYERVVNNESLLKRNWKLMQLHDVDISLSKSKQIREACENDKSTLNRMKFRSLYQQDQLWNAIDNPNQWVYDRFSKLDRFAKQDDKS